MAHPSPWLPPPLTIGCYTNLVLTNRIGVISRATFWVPNIFGLVHNPCQKYYLPKSILESQLYKFLSFIHFRDSKTIVPNYNYINCFIFKRQFYWIWKNVGCFWSIMWRYTCFNDTPTFGIIRAGVVPRVILGIPNIFYGFWENIGYSWSIMWRYTCSNDSPKYEI